MKTERIDPTMLAWARMMRVSTALLTRVERRLRAAGFPPLAWYDALLELKRAGNDGLRQNALQREMLLAQYSMSRLTERLAGGGYVEVSACPEDGRGQVLKITQKGRRLQADMWPIYRAAVEEDFGAQLGEGEAEALAGLLANLQKRD